MMIGPQSDHRKISLAPNLITEKSDHRRLLKIVDEYIFKKDKTLSPQNKSSGVRRHSQTVVKLDKVLGSQTKGFTLTRTWTS